MSKATKLGKVPIIRYSGIFDFDKLYKIMYKWFNDYNYDFYEPTYKDKAGLLGREIEIDWKTEKKINAFYKFEITVGFHLWDVQDIEVIQEGEKKTLTKARMELKITGNVVADYQERWAQSPFMQALLKFYMEHVVYRQFALKYYDTLYYRVYKLHTLVKDSLNAMTKGSAF